MCICMYMCVYVCMYMYTYVYVHLYIHTHICIYININVYMYLYQPFLQSSTESLASQVFISGVVYRHMYVCMCTHIYGHTHIHMADDFSQFMSRPQCFMFHLVDRASLT